MCNYVSVSVGLYSKRSVRNRFTELRTLKLVIGHEILFGIRSAVYIKTQASKDNYMHQLKISRSEQLKIMNLSLKQLQDMNN